MALRRAWQGQRKHLALSGTSSDVKSARLTMFSMAALSPYRSCYPINAFWV